MMAWEAPPDADGRPRGATHLALPTMDRSLCGRRWLRLGPRWTRDADESGAGGPVCPECREALAGLLAATFPAARPRRG